MNIHFLVHFETFLFYFINISTTGIITLTTLRYFVHKMSDPKEIESSLTSTFITIQRSI